MREGRSHPQNAKDFPAVAVDNYWFRDADHSQFAAALATVSDPGDGERTRIAHLDTGFDPDHLSRPIHLSKSEQRNFVEADAPADARDRSAGLFNAFSHGTGTLSKEMKGQRVATIGCSHPGRSLTGEGDLLAAEARLVADHGTGAALALQAVTHGDARWFALDSVSRL